MEFGTNDREKRARWLQSYLACISLVDAQLGKVLDELEKSGLQDNTIVVLTSDHGYHIGEHFQYGKVTLFQESTRVPLMIRTPKMKVAGQSSDSFAELLDLYPTLTELCGLVPPKHLQGKSLAPILKNPQEVVRYSAYTVVTRPDHPGMVAKCLHMGPWRYTEWKGPEDAELYHLENDPSEHENLIDNPEYIHVIKELRGKLVDRHL
jgi:iduronate 2-sulfatase